MKLLDSDIKTREILGWKGIHLLNYQFSACSMKTRIYLNLKNIPFKSHQINLSAGENFSPWFQGINPRSLVPVLIHDGDVHIESNDILQYLEGCFKNNPLIPADKQTQVSELLSFEDDLHIDIRNITFRFMVPRLLNKGKKAKPKSNDKAALHGEVDPLDDANRKFWQEYEEFGIKDEDVKESLIRMNNALNNIDSILNENDYILGSNHVLPTSRSARFASSLSVLDFMKRTSISKMSLTASKNLGAVAKTLATSETLHAHAISASLRIPLKDE